MNKDTILWGGGEALRLSRRCKEMTLLSRKSAFLEVPSNELGQKDMSMIVSELEARIQDVYALREMKIPKYRQAYSDRTAWLMACISELAYIRFNPIMSGPADKYFRNAVEQIMGSTRSENVAALIASVSYDPDEEKARLSSGLKMLGLRIEDTFDEMGTQAILASCDDFVVLGFRGTEATSIRDIKADANGVSKEARESGRVHSGFDSAFLRVEGKIKAALVSGRFDDKPLFITGHSLGGALATLAARRLEHTGGIAGCYTFGAPRVADEGWIGELKTPVYRLVNAADCVTMLPPGVEIVTAAGWLAGWIPTAGPSFRAWILKKLGGYMHGGNMRYLTNCPADSYGRVRLLYSVSLLLRVKGMIVKKLPWRHFLKDHSISVYRKKLWVIAERRNRTGVTGLRSDVAGRGIPPCPSKKARTWERP